MKYLIILTLALVSCKSDDDQLNEFDCIGLANRYREFVENASSQEQRNTLISEYQTRAEDNGCSVQDVTN